MAITINHFTFNFVIYMGKNLVSKISIIYKWPFCLISQQISKKVEYCGTSRLVEICTYSIDAI